MLKFVVKRILWRRLRRKGLLPLWRKTTRVVIESAPRRSRFSKPYIQRYRVEWLGYAWRCIPKDNN